MSAWAPGEEVLVRFGAFLAVFAAMALWEGIAPRRALLLRRPRRWLHNVALAVVDALAVRVLLPLGALGTAALAASRGWGLLRQLDLPPALLVVVSVILLDLAIYLQHVLFHAVPALWRLHRVHHADLDFDLTTGVRFHPLEILLSMLIKMSAVAALGAPVVAVLVFEVLLNATSMFNHGNVRLPERVDRALRWIVVTPDMHRVHHSVALAELNRNYGFNLPWWDRLLGSYRSQPAAGHQAMTIGVAALQERRVHSLAWMLALPFRRAGNDDGGSAQGERQSRSAGPGSSRTTG